MESIEFSDDAIEFPLPCENCGEVHVFEGEERDVFTVGEPGDPLEDDEWYLHWFSEPLDITDDGEVVECRVIALCDDCAPETLLSDAEADAYIEGGDGH